MNALEAIQERDYTEMSEEKKPPKRMSRELKSTHKRPNEPYMT